MFHSDSHDFVLPEAGRLNLFPAWKIHAVENAGRERVHLFFSAYRHVDMPYAEVSWPMEAPVSEV